MVGGTKAHIQNSVENTEFVLKRNARIIRLVLGSMSQGVLFQLQDLLSLSLGFLSDDTLRK